MKIVLGLIMILGLQAQAFDSGPYKNAVVRKVAQEPKGVCERQAGNVAKGIAKSLNQDVNIEKVVLLESRQNLEIYNVKLKGKGFSSPETTKYWMIQLYDLGDGCSYKSATLEDAAG